MTDRLQELFAALREACEPREWSRGVELQRGDAVDALTAGEPMELRVRTPGRTVAPTVTLHVADAEWSCTCDGEDPCEHVVAAVLALRAARKEGRELTVSKKAGGEVGYRLSRDGDRMLVARVAVRSGSETPIEGTLGALLSGREQGPELELTKVDLTIDQFLQQNRVRSLPAERFAFLLPLLAQASNVTLDGVKVTVSETPFWPHVILERSPRGFRLRFTRPELEVVLVVPGLVCVGGERLQPVGVPELVGGRLERLPCEQLYEGEKIAELVTRVFPEWRERTTIEERAALPLTEGALPVRPLLEVTQRGSQLHVVASVGYGDPPLARVVGDGLQRLPGAKLPVIERNLRAERRAVERLRESLDLVPGRAAEFSGSEAVSMAARLRSVQGFSVFGDAHEVHYPLALTAEFSVDAERFDVAFLGEAGGDVRRVDAAQVLEAWQAGAGAVPLLGGGWAPLPTDWLERYGHRLRDLLQARDTTGRVAAYGKPALARLCAELDHPAPIELQRLEPLAREFEGLPSAVLPADLLAELRPYQRRGVDWLCFLREAGLGALLADDMGLGKTLQTLCALRGRALVVCPRSVVHNWVDELRRFRPGLSVSVYHGAQRTLPESGVVVTTYALLRRDIDSLSQVEWDALVLDEAQAIKNPESQVAEAAHRLKGAFRVALSGTPVENRLDELWSLMHFCNPGLLGGLRAIRDDYERPIAEGVVEAGKRLRERIRPFLMRRKKSEVATDLPPRIECVLSCELEPEERAVYEAVLLATRASVVRDLEAGGNVMKALEALLRLRQAACDITLVPGQSARAEASSKIQRLMLALEEAAADGHKALVFSQWTSLLDRVERELEGAGIRWTRLDGSTEDRASVVAEFQSEDGPPVMLLSLKAGGTGLNLTAADHVFLLDPWWNPAAEDQAADRAHRIGQLRSVLVHRLIAKDTVEERILELQGRKRALAAVALDEGAAAAQLTREDLLLLFS